MHKFFVVAPLALASLAACTSSLIPTPVDDLVPVEVIVNTLKCEVAKVVTNLDVQTQRRLASIGQQFTVTLKLKTVNKATLAAEAGGDLSILALNSFIPSANIGGSIEPTITVDTTTKMTIYGVANNLDICTLAKSKGMIIENGIGFSRYVNDLSENINRVAPGSPKMITDKVIYDTTFGITVTGKGSLKYGFVPLAVTGKFEESNSRTQQVIIEFDNWKKTASTRSAGTSTAESPPERRCIKPDECVEISVPASEKLPLNTPSLPDGK